MDLYKEIFIRALAHETMEVTFPNLRLDGAELVHSVCYQTLERIKGIVQDESLSDSECFAQIEEIVLALEDIGSGGGTRHDFG